MIAAGEIAERNVPPRPTEEGKLDRGCDVVNDDEEELKGVVVVVVVDDADDDVDVTERALLNGAIRADDS